LRDRFLRSVCGPQPNSAGDNAFHRETLPARPPYGGRSSFGVIAMEEAFIMLLLFSTVTIFTLGILLARARGRLQEMERALGMRPPLIRQMQQRDEDSGEVRVAQLERQVDQIANHLERLTDSQDFLSRILTDKLDRLPEARLDTPH
jgi:hypothetical protein